VEVARQCVCDLSGFSWWRDVGRWGLSLVSTSFGVRRVEGKWAWGTLPVGPSASPILLGSSLRSLGLWAHGPFRVLVLILLNRSQPGTCFFLLFVLFLKLVFIRWHLQSSYSWYCGRWPMKGPDAPLLQGCPKFLWNVRGSHMVLWQMLHMVLTEKLHRGWRLPRTGAQCAIWHSGPPQAFAHLYLMLESSRTPFISLLLLWHILFCTTTRLDFLKYRCDPIILCYWKLWYTVGERINWSILSREWFDIM
jgi:hypothetical protein